MTGSLGTCEWMREIERERFERYKMREWDRVCVRERACERVCERLSVRESVCMLWMCRCGCECGCGCTRERVCVCCGCVCGGVRVREREQRWNILRRFLSFKNYRAMLSKVLNRVWTFSRNSPRPGKIYRSAPSSPTSTKRRRRNRRRRHLWPKKMRRRNVWRRNRRRRQTLCRRECVSLHKIYFIKIYLPSFLQVLFNLIRFIVTYDLV